MRTDRRGSVHMEAVMVIPIVLVMILLGRYIYEASINRQETAIFARGATVAAAAARSTFIACDFERDQFIDLTEVGQAAQVRCRRQNAESGLSRERPIWDEVEDGAAAWRTILRDVKPSRSPSDIVGTADVTLTITNSNLLAEQDDLQSRQRYLAPERTLWSHDERQFQHGHDRVIWDEICRGRGATYALFPNVFPNGGGPRC
jgi:hypothetical protein